MSTMQSYKLELEFINWKFSKLSASKRFIDKLDEIGHRIKNIEFFEIFYDAKNLKKDR